VPKPILIGQPDFSQLEVICDALNTSKASWVPEFRRLILRLQQSGPDLQAMMYEDQALWRDLSTAYSVKWLPSKTGRSHLALMPAGDPRDPRSTARYLFLALTLNPDWARLGGPCPRCERFFIRKTAKMSTYCSHRCASRATATEATAKARLEEHTDKLVRAEKAKLEWEKVRRKGRTKKAWKEWVEACEPDITIRFLTRAVNKGELQPPSESKKERP